MSSDETIELDAYDVMRYEQSLSEFLNRHTDFDDQLSDWENGRMLGERKNLSDVSESDMTISNATDAHPLYSRVSTTREEINKWLTTKRLKLLLPVVDVINAGRAIELFDEFNVLDLSDSSSDTSIGEEYVHRLLDENETLDALFELEAAALFHRNNFDVQLVKEGDEGGRDLVITEEDIEVSIECKRKVGQAKFDEEMEYIDKSISDNVWNQVDIGKDSFVIRISSDTAPRRDAIDQIADEITRVLENQLDEGSVEVDGNEFEINLIDYYEGGRVTDYTGGQPTTPSEAMEMREEIDPMGHLDYEVDPMDTEGHGDVQIFVNELGQVVIMNAYMMEFDFPKYDDVQYNDLIRDTISSASGQISGHAPGIVLVDIPQVAIDQMQRRKTESYHGGQVSHWERLVDEQIIGLLNQSDSLNAVVLTSRIQNQEDGLFQMGRPIELDSPVHSVINIDPSEELPSRLREFIEGSQVEDAA